MLLFIGTSEILVIVLAILLLFGSKKIPEVARTIGRGYREFQKATDEIKRELSDIEREPKPKATEKTGSSAAPEPKSTDNQ